jgi:hypothetical protein
MRGLGAALTLLIGLAAGPANAELKMRDGEICHDLVVIGEVTGYGEFLSYHEMDPSPDEDAIYLGGRQQMRVQVETVVAGEAPPPTIEVRALMGAAYRLPTTMILYLQREERGTYWAADWRRVERGFAGRAEAADAVSPRCKA